MAIEKYNSDPLNVSPSNDGVAKTAKDKMLTLEKTVEGEAEYEIESHETTEGDLKVEITVEKPDITAKGGLNEGRDDSCSCSFGIMKKLPLNALGLFPDEVKSRHPLTYAKLFTSHPEIVFEVIFLAELPKATIKRVFKDAGADRVSGDVPEKVNEIVTEMAKAAVESAEEDGRKTVSPRDLKLVVIS